MSTDMMQPATRRQDTNPLDTQISELQTETAQHHHKQQPTFQSAATLDTDLAMPARPAKSEEPAQTQAPQEILPQDQYVPTVLDRIVDFLALLIKKLERFLIGMLEGRQRKKLRRSMVVTETEDKAQMPEPHQDLDSALIKNKIKWQDRKIKDLEF